MKKIKVSVIIPIYNAQKYLKKAINSIINQTLKEIEIICVNDGSTDKSLAILKELKLKDKRIKIIDKKNGGAGSARNEGLKIAKGEYLSFLDADDFFEKEMLEKAYLCATKNDNDIVVFNSDQYREDLKAYHKVDWVIRKDALPPYRPIYHRNLTDNVFKVFVGWAWDKLFKREFILKHDLKFQELRTSNDMCFVFSALVLASKIEIVDEILVHQRRNNPDSLSNTREKSWDCFYEALKGLKNNLIKYHLFDELKQDYINYALHFSLWNIITLKGDKKEVLFHKLKEEWFRELEINKYPEDYFYNKQEYKEYERIINNNYKSWLTNQNLFGKGVS